MLDNAYATIKALRASLAQDGGSRAAAASHERQMRVSAVKQETLHRLFIYDQTGSWVASSLGPSEFESVRGLNYTDRDYFRNHRDHSEDVVLIGPPIQTRFNGDWVITVTRRINRQTRASAASSARHSP